MAGTMSSLLLDYPNLENRLGKAKEFMGKLLRNADRRCRTIVGMKSYLDGREKEIRYYKEASVEFSKVSLGLISELFRDFFLTICHSQNVRGLSLRYLGSAASLKYGAHDEPADDLFESMNLGAEEHLRSSESSGPGRNSKVLGHFSVLPFLIAQYYHDVWG